MRSTPFVLRAPIDRACTPIRCRSHCICRRSPSRPLVDDNGPMGNARRPSPLRSGPTGVGAAFVATCNPSVGPWHCVQCHCARRPTGWDSRPTIRALRLVLHIEAVVESPNAADDPWMAIVGTRLPVSGSMGRGRHASVMTRTLPRARRVSFGGSSGVPVRMERDARRSTARSRRGPGCRAPP